MPRSTAATIDDYVAEFPPETQAVLEEIRALIRAEARDADETISYAIPTFDLNGTHLCHFAAFKNHLSFFPTGSGADAFADELKAHNITTPITPSEGRGGGLEAIAGQHERIDRAGPQLRTDRG